MLWRTEELRRRWCLPGTTVEVRRNVTKGVHQIFDGEELISSWTTLKRAKNEAERYYATKEKDHG